MHDLIAAPGSEPRPGCASRRELSRRVELVILQGSDGSEVVAERRIDGLIEVLTTHSLGAAQAWVEAHYEGVEWPKPRLATALIGRLGGDRS